MADSKGARRLFPLKTIGDVLEVFRSQLRFDRKPNLAQLSIICGLIESSLTSSKEGIKESFSGCLSSLPQSISSPTTIQIPHISYNTVDALTHKFTTQIKGSVDLSLYPKKTSRELIKKISDVIWSHLTRTYYKDRAHLQTIYSYLTGNKLDCFGVAYAVVAACQILGLDDVQLALSEDHAWVVFGDGMHSIID
jgi:menin